jgi:hypothetical protein
MPRRALYQHPKALDIVARRDGGDDLDTATVAAPSVKVQ